jgi:hypothetical protein
MKAYIEAVTTQLRFTIPENMVTNIDSTLAIECALFINTAMQKRQRREKGKKPLRYFFSSPTRSVINDDITTDKYTPYKSQFLISHIFSILLILITL